MALPGAYRCSRRTAPVHSSSTIIVPPLELANTSPFFGAAKLASMSMYESKARTRLSSSSERSSELTPVMLHWSAPSKLVAHALDMLCTSNAMTESSWNARSAGESSANASAYASTVARLAAIAAAMSAGSPPLMISSSAMRCARCDRTIGRMAW